MGNVLIIWITRGYPHQPPSTLNHLERQNLVPSISMTWSAALDSASPKPTTSMCCPFGSLNRWFRGGGRLCSCDLKYQKGSAKAPITHLRPLLSWLNYNSFEYSHHMGIKTPSSTQCSHTSKDGVCWGDLRLSWLIPHLLLIDSPFSLDTSINPHQKTVDWFPEFCRWIPSSLFVNLVTSIFFWLYLNFFWLNLKFCWWNRNFCWWAFHFS